MTIDLDALERIAQAATPGPWKFPHRNWPGVVVSAQGCLWNPGIGQINDDTDAEHIAAFDPPTVIALIARVRELEAIVNDGGNQAAKYWTRMTAAEREMHARELHHFEEEKLRAEAEAERDRYREAIEEMRAMLPGPRTFAESLARDFEGRLWPRTIDADRVTEILARALNGKETN